MEERGVITPVLPSNGVPPGVPLSIIAASATVTRLVISEKQTYEIMLKLISFNRKTKALYVLGDPQNLNNNTKFYVSLYRFWPSNACVKTFACDQTLLLTPYMLLNGHVWSFFKNFSQFHLHCHIWIDLEKLFKKNQEA